MHDLSHRAALAALAASGLLIVASQVGGLPPATALGAWPAGSALPLVQHGQFMLGLFGAALLLATVLPALRLPAIGAALLSEASFLAISWLGSGAPALAQHWSRALGVVLLLAAGAVFLQEARRQARWEGVLPSRASGA